MTRTFTTKGQHRNMTDKQRERSEAETARIMLFGRELVSDRIIGRWSEGVTGEELVRHLYDDPGLVGTPTRELAGEKAMFDSASGDQR